MMNILVWQLIGLLIGLGVAWCLVRLVYKAGKACGYLEGRAFLVKRRVMLRTHVWVDGLPIDNTCCVWVETNDFTADERRVIDAVDKWRADHKTEGSTSEKRPADAQTFYPRPALLRVDPPFSSNGIGFGDS